MAPNSDIAIIKTKLEYIAATLTRIENNNATMESRINNNENRVISLEARTNNMAVFQTVFSVVVGAIASYLGVNKR